MRVCDNANPFGFNVFAHNSVRYASLKHAKALPAILSQMLLLRGKKRLKAFFIQCRKKEFFLAE
jgi:hypothetical protein